MKYPVGKPYNQIFAYDLLHPLIYKIPKLRGILVKRRLNKTISEINADIDRYNVILIHGFWLTSCYIFSKLEKKNIFSVGAIWGSDFYERTEENENMLFKTMDSCDLVVISTNKMVEDILNVKSIEKDKIRNCLFGLAPLEYLFEMQNVSAKQSKKTLGFEEHNFIITCGYNAAPINQHLKVISILSDIKFALPQNTKLIVPLTYGGDKKYRSHIKKALVNSQLNYLMFENFLTDEDAAHLRKATDLMIQVPVVDAFSGSMQEHLFAQNIVIIGTWLPYQSLDEKGIYYVPVDTISELKQKLIFVFNNLDEIKNKVIKSNTPDKFKSSLWTESIKEWHRVLSEYKSSKNES